MTLPKMLCFVYCHICGQKNKLWTRTTLINWGMISYLTILN